MQRDRESQTQTQTQTGRQIDRQTDGKRDIAKNSKMTKEPNIETEND